MDPFALLGLPRKFDLEPAAIRRAHLAAVTRPTAGGDDVQEEVGEAGAELNRAKQILMDPEQRADVLVRLLGGPSKEADKSLPTGYLMEMMQTREEIDGASTSDDQQRWHDWAATRRAEHIARVGELFRLVLAGGTPELKLLKDIRVELNAWRYIERLVEQLDGHEGDFGG